MSGPSAAGRFTAIALGIVAGGFATLYMMKDFELVRRLDDPQDRTSEPRPFRVRFERSEPLKLKPEAQAKLDEAKAALEAQKKDST